MVSGDLGEKNQSAGVFCHTVTSSSLSLFVLVALQ